MKKTNKRLLATILCMMSISQSSAFAAEDDEPNVEDLGQGHIVRVEAGQYIINGRIETFDGDTFTTDIDISDVSSNDTLSYNTIEIDAKGVTGTVNSGNASDFTGTISDNTVNIVNGTLSAGPITLAEGSTATGNTITIYNGSKDGEKLYDPADNPDLTNLYLYGGIVGNADISSGNTLSVYTKGITAAGVAGFDTLDFRYPKGSDASGTALTVTGDADIRNAFVKVSSAGGTSITTGDTLTLISAGSLNADGFKGNDTFYEGVSLAYDMTVKQSGNSLTAEIGEARPIDSGVTDPILEPNIVFEAASDRIMDWLPPEEQQMESEQQSSESGSEGSEGESSDDEGGSGGGAPGRGTGFGPFANIGGGMIRTRTGNGHYIDTRSGGIDIGFARTVEDGGGKLVFAPLIDYAESSYESNANGITGTGKARYWAGGVIARKMQENGFYYEGSVRLGRTKMDYESNDYTQEGIPRHIDYNTDGTVYGAHIRLGRLLPLDRENSLHVYGLYSHAHQGSMSATLPTGDNYSFDSVDSGRARLGARLTRKATPTSRFYSGIAYQYEFTGEATSHYAGTTIREASMKGSSGMLELGWQMKPAPDAPMMLDVAAVGWAGRQRGITFQAKLARAF